MKTIFILAIIAFAAAKSDYYILEDMDINELIDNMDDFTEFTNCVLEKIPCNKVYESYRANTLEAIQQSCKRCTPEMKNKFWKYLEVLKTRLPNEYVEFRHKYDPDNKFIDAHESELANYAEL